MDLRTPPDSSVFECNEPDVIFEDFGDETVLIHLGSGHYYSMDPVGMALWGLLSERVPVAEVMRHAAARYDGPEEEIRSGVAAFVARLCEEDLLRAAADVAADPGTVPGVGAAPVPFVPPTLSKFEDMEEMLLLDPVHDVTMDGWPSVGRAAPERRANDGEGPDAERAS